MVVVDEAILSEATARGLDPTDASFAAALGLFQTLHSTSPLQHTMFSKSMQTEPGCAILDLVICDLCRWVVGASTDIAWILNRVEPLSPGLFEPPTSPSKCRRS